MELTRSEPIEIPDGVTCVVVRGHDETHGYGGQVMLVNLETGATKAIQQGQERANLSDETCPSNLRRGFKYRNGASTSMR